MATFQEFHGISLAPNSWIENFVVEQLDADPIPVGPGRVWFNTTDRVFRQSTLDGSGGVIVRTFATIEDLQDSVSDIEASIADVESALAAEVSRATTAEGVLTSNLAAEVSRATAAEGTLATNLATEIANRETAISDVVSAQSVVDAAQDAAIGTKVNRAGDTMGGNLAFNGTYRIIGLADPETATDAVNKGYVDNLINGLTWLPPVDAVVTELPTGELENGYRVLNLTDAKIYTVEGGSFNAGVLPPNNSAVMDKETDAGFVKSDDAEWVQFTGAGQVNAGVGLIKDGNILNVNLGAGIAELPTDEVGVDLFSAGGLYLTVDGVTASEGSNAQVAIKVNGSTLTVNSDGIKVADSVIADITSNASGVAAEKARAEAAEAQLAADIAAERSRAMGVENTIASDLEDERTRAMGVESTIQSDLLEEITRSTNADATLTANLGAEVTRAQAAEAQLTSDLAAEVSRATAAEGVLTSNLAAEVSRATAAEGGIAADLNTESTRAQAAELALDVKIGDLSDLTTSDTSSVVNAINEVVALAGEGVESAISNLVESINLQRYTEEVSTPATSHTITHNLGSSLIDACVWIDRGDGVWRNDMAAVSIINGNSIKVELTAARKVLVTVERLDPLPNNH